MFPGNTKEYNNTVDYLIIPEYTPHLPEYKASTVYFGNIRKYTNIPEYYGISETLKDSVYKRYYHTSTLFLYENTKTFLFV